MSGNDTYIYMWSQKWNNNEIQTRKEEIALMNVSIIFEAVVSNETEKGFGAGDGPQN